MNTNLHSHRGENALEIALNPNDLRVRAQSRIYEQDSTAGFEEVPEVQASTNRTVTNRMIQTDQQWGIAVRWIVEGIFACFLNCGHWKTKVYFELMGGGETSFSPGTVTKDLGISGQVYSTEISIKPGELAPGVYRVITCLQYCFEDGNPGPIAGFIDGGLIKVFQDHKTERKVAPVANGLAAASF